MIADYVKPFHYTIPWKSTSVHYGGHKGTQRGLGDDYRGNVSLIDYPDAKKLCCSTGKREILAIIVFYHDISLELVKQMAAFRGVHLGDGRLLQYIY